MSPLLLFGLINGLWHAVPLIVAISFVYAATRHESMSAITQHAIRLGAWITGFMAVVFVILLLMSWWV